MTDGNDESEDATEGASEVTPEDLEARLEEAAEELDAAETEADLDEVEAALDEVEADLEAADLPEPDDEDEDDPGEQLESRLSDLREDVEEARGPYAEDVVAEIESAQSTVDGEQWTEEGVDDLAGAVRSFVGAVEDALGVGVDVRADDPTFDEQPYVDGSELDGFQETLAETADVVAGAGLDPDDDGATIADLLAAAGDLQDDVDAARSWDDLTVREKLLAHGYFEVLEHRKDFPPEWGALKVWETRGRADMVLLAFDLMDSDFMERHCLEALERMGPEEAVDPMLDLAGKRNKDAVRILGKIGSEEALEQLLEYADAGDPQLRAVTLKALGEMGSTEATQAVAEGLAADEAEIRSRAARSLGLIGDTRAIEPLADALADDEADRVRASAAWALNQIGTRRALDVLGEYTEDRSYVVQTEAEKAL